MRKLFTSECGYIVTYNKVSDKKFAEVVGQVTTFEIVAIFDDKVAVKSVGVAGTMESEMVKVAP